MDKHRFKFVSSKARLDCSDHSSINPQRVRTTFRYLQTDIFFLPVYQNFLIYIVLLAIL